ncbi:hypothetical protein ACFQX6_15530 [Streptosporangium lutulentum]
MPPTGRRSSRERRPRYREGRDDDHHGGPPDAGSGRSRHPGHLTGPGGGRGAGAGGARELLPVATPARTRAVVRELLRPHRGLLLGGFVVMVAATVVGLLTQPLLGHIVDLVTVRRPVEALTMPRCSWCSSRSHRESPPRSGCR